MAVIVIDGLVPGGAVVPDRDVARAPANAAGVFGFRAVLLQVGDQCRAFFRRPAVKMRGELRVHVERLSARQGMFDNAGVNAVLGGGYGVADAAILATF